MKSDSYRRRLSNIFDKTTMGNASHNFPKEIGNVPSNISDFFLQSLSDTDKIDSPSIKNTLNFVQTWYALGNNLNQDVINQIVYIVLEMPTFTPQFTILLKYFKNLGWLYNSLSYCLRHNPKLVKESISKDDPIWKIFLQYFVKDFNAKKKEAKKEYKERECSYLIEVFCYFWPLEKNDSTNIIELANAFVNFCKETRSRTSIQLLHLVVEIFPRDFKSSDFKETRPKDEEVDERELLSHIDPETGKFII